MTTPRYYTGRPAWLVSACWALALAVACGLGLWLSGRAVVRQIRADERQRLEAASADVLTTTIAAERARWQRAVDSLAAVVAEVDTVLVTRLRTVHDTAWLPADTAVPVRYAACRAALDAIATECATFRTAALARLAAADSVRQMDVTAHTALAQQLASVRASEAGLRQELGNRPRWRHVWAGVAVGAAVSAMVGPRVRVVR